MFEKPLQQDGQPDRNALLAQIESLEERILSLNRRKESLTQEGQIGPVNAQISELEQNLREARSGLQS